MCYRFALIAALVTSPTAVRVMMTLLSTNSTWLAELIHLEGVFLLGKFENREELYIKVRGG